MKRIRDSPKGSSTSGHDQDWLPLVSGKVFKYGLPLLGGDFAVDAFEWDVMSFEVPSNEIQCPSPT